MKILSYLVFVFFLTETHGNHTDELDSSDPFNRVVRFVNSVCASIDDCKLPCCLLNEIYFAAKNQCDTNIDGQLSDVEWTSPFSAVHITSCKSVCPQHVINNETIPGQLFETFRNAAASEDLCDDFVSVGFNYTSENIHDFAALDFLWGVFVPVLSIGVAILLMAFTLVLYLVVPDLRRRIQDKCFLFYLSSRVVYLSFFLIILFTEFEGFMCYFAAFIHQFSGLSSEFWLNIICFHLWRCIKSVIPPFESAARTISLYSIYAWGCSLLATGLTHLADTWLPEKSHFRPRLEETCTIKGYDESKGSQLLFFQPKFIYFYSITIITQVINLCAFIHIAYIISSKDKVLKSKGNESMRRHGQHQIKHLGLLIYLKLFLLMGFIRVLDLIFLHFGKTNIAVTTGCFLNGIFVTIIFVCNKRVLRSGKRRFYHLSSSL